MLLWLALIVSLIRSAPGNSATIDPSLFVMVYGLMAIVFASKAFFIYMISIGRNWARITYSVVIALGLYKVLPDTVSWISEMSVPGLLSLTSVTLQLIGVCLLFTPPSNQQFRQPVQDSVNNIFNKVYFFAIYLFVISSLILNLFNLVSGEFISILPMATLSLVFYCVYNRKSWASTVVKIWSSLLIISGAAMWAAVFFGGETYLHSTSNAAIKTFSMALGVYFFTFANQVLQTKSEI
jgi:hypothetical protein